MNVFSEKNFTDKNWYKDWFNSPYYHKLYKDRDHLEAKTFIHELFKYLQPKKNAQILDVACGKGRHAIEINKLGYQVDAFDLSENNIKIAKAFENKSLHFYINDIRSPLKLNHYDYCFNLFTSFGYFTEEEDNYKSIQAIAKSMKENGVLVIDFMNSNKVKKGLVAKEKKIIDDITFDITRKIEKGFIIKVINFSDKGRSYEYEEKVKIITLENFKDYFNAAGLKLTTTFGDYHLSDFDIESSERLIMVAKK